MKTETIPGLSVIIHTKNAAETVAATLDSVGMAQEILIIDMHSQDETKQIVHRYPKIKFFEVEDVGYADPARNFGIEKAAGPWILVIDADEVLPETLAAKIPELMESEETVCYFLPRKNIIFGAWIEKTGWWPDYQARLFKKGHVSWELGVHKQATVNGVVEQLPATEENALLHYNYRSIKQFI